MKMSGWGVIQLVEWWVTSARCGYTMKGSPGAPQALTGASPMVTGIPGGSSGGTKYPSP